MPLSRFDLERISTKGYRFNDFVVKRGGKCYLKNINGRCVFLKENGCGIYSLRPEGCRFYPLVFDENYGKVVIHDFCPYGHEFKVRKDDIGKLYDLFKKLNKKE